MKKLKRVLNKKHNYVELNDGFDKVISMINNMTLKTRDAVDAYSGQWIIYTTHKEGVFFLFEFPWNVISRLFGTYKYHANFLDSLHFKIEEINKKFEEHCEIIDGQQTIGFTVNKK